jgi:hypothetical protein
MKNIFLILLILPVALFGQAKKKHVHQYYTKQEVQKAGNSNPALYAEIVGSDEYEPKLRRDTAAIKHNVITYINKVYKCKLCGEWYGPRQNVDTFSTRRPPKYSNLKNKQQANQKKKKN